MKTLATLIALCALAPTALAVGDVNTEKLFTILKPYVGCDEDPVTLGWNPDLGDPSTLVPQGGPYLHFQLEKCLP